MAPRAGLAATDPPSPVVRNPDDNSAKNPLHESGNDANAPPCNDSGPSRLRNATPATTTTKNDATSTGCAPTSEAVRSRRRRPAVASSSCSSISRCSSKICPAAANHRGDRRPADSMTGGAGGRERDGRIARARASRAFRGRWTMFHPQAARTSIAPLESSGEHQICRAATSQEQTSNGKIHSSVSIP